MTHHIPHRFRRINCRNVASYVQQELDVRLQSALHRQIREHLRRCPNCTAYLESLKKVILLYRRVPAPHLPKKMGDGLFAVLKLD